MRILMLGNSLTFANDMPTMLAGLTGAKVVQHTRGGVHPAEAGSRLTSETIAAAIQSHKEN